MADGATTTDGKSAKVIREGEKVYLDGEFGFSSGFWASSVHGCQAKILQTVGSDLTYEDLVCYSGFAFRTQVHEHMCPSAGHPCCGFMCIDNGLRAIHWRMEFFERPGEDASDEDRSAFEAKVRAAIRDSIDRGIPVHYGSEEDGLIIGYQGDRWWCWHPYHKDGKEPFWHDEAKDFAGSNGEWPWGIVVWKEPKPADQQPDPRDLTITALRQAVEMWSAGKAGDYLIGDASYGHWLAWLRGVEAGTVREPEAGIQGNSWCFAVLCMSRTIAGAWLASQAELFDGVAREQLLIAAGECQRMAEELTAGFQTPWDLAPPIWQARHWTGDQRKTQIARLESARPRDAAAIEAIAQALASLEPTAGE